MIITQYLPSGNEVIYDFGSNIEWEKNSFEQTAQIMNGEASGRFELTGDMYITYDSAFYQFKGTLVRGKNCSVGDWDKFYRILTSPYNNHYISLPTYVNPGREYINIMYIYVSKVERKLIKRISLPKNTVVDLQNFCFNKWGNKIDVEFVSMEKYAPF